MQENVEVNNQGRVSNQKTFIKNPSLEQVLEEPDVIEFFRFVNKHNLRETALEILTTRLSRLSAKAN